LKFVPIRNSIGAFWQDAETTCQELSGHLASIHSEAENQFISGRETSVE